MRSLELLDELAAGGRFSFTLSDVRDRLGVSAPSAVNLLNRLKARGLVDRVSHGHYAIRQIGVLGTSAASEDVALAVGALFGDRPHRIAYRSALDLLGRSTHPGRVIQVASPHRIRIEMLSGRPFQGVIEPTGTVGIGAVREGAAWASDAERALLDAAARPALVGGVSTLTEAMTSGSADAERIMEYARRLRAAPALRRLGSLADSLHLPGLAGRLQPLEKPKSYLDLDPGAAVLGDDGWRDRTWRVRWPASREEIVAALAQ